MLCVGSLASRLLISEPGPTSRTQSHPNVSSMLHTSVLCAPCARVEQKCETFFYVCHIHDDLLVVASWVSVFAKSD